MLQADQSSAPIASDVRDTRNALVLVLDDDALVHKLVRKILQRGGLSYSGVKSAEAALDYLQSHEPELILSDIMMDGMNGIEFCERIHADERLKNIPLIFFTGLSDMSTLSQAYESGASDYVVKPLRQEEVLSRVRHHIIEHRKKIEAERRINDLNFRNESKTKFLGVASHDLRNPLVSIRGISQYLESERFGPLNEGQRELVSTVIQASETMLSLVEDLLDVSKYETGQFRIAPERVQLLDMLEHAVALHQPTASRKKITLSSTPRDGETSAEIDRKLVARLIDNLVSNAIKFSNPGTSVSLTLLSTSDEVAIVVEDEGPGIPEDEFDQLFKEFGRTSNQPTGGESSSGIGLYVCRRIASSHGGRITAENRPNGGARFTAFLKRAFNEE